MVENAQTAKPCMVSPVYNEEKSHRPNRRRWLELYGNLA